MSSKLCGDQFGSAFGESPSYGMFPDKFFTVCRVLKITDRQMKILLLLYRFRGPDGCHPSTHTLLEHLGESDRQNLYKELRALQGRVRDKETKEWKIDPDKAFIKIDSGNRRLANSYDMSPFEQKAFDMLALLGRARVQGQQPLKTFLVK